VDTLGSPLLDRADVVLPSCTWAEKSGTFENARGLIQAFEQAIVPVEASKSEGQIALELIAALQEPIEGTPSEHAGKFDAQATRRAMAQASSALSVFATGISAPAAKAEIEPDMQMVEL
jgi:NADH-quinone oxidoreductase subunit G